MAGKFSHKKWDEVKQLFVHDQKSPEDIAALPGMPAIRTIRRHADDGEWKRERESVAEAETNDLAVLRRHRAKLLAKLDSIADGIIGTEDDPTSRITLDIQRVDNRIAEAEHEVDKERAVRIGGLEIVKYLREPSEGNDPELAALVADVVEPAANFARGRHK